MKIDLYNNHETFIAESKQDAVVRLWCKTKNISFDYVMTHPNLKDIQFLIEFNDEFNMELHSNARLKGVFDGYWGVVYAQRKQLKPKAFVKLERLAQECLAIRTQHQNTRLKIKSLRHTGTSHAQNTDHDKEAKGSNSVQSNVYEKNIQRGGREVQELLPWE